MIIEVRIDYIALDTARYLGVLEKFLDRVNEIADNYTVGKAKEGIVEMERIGRLVYKVRPIITGNQIEIRIEPVN